MCAPMHVKTGNTCMHVVKKDTLAQMHAKRKEPVANNEEELTEAEHTSSGNGLLQKKRLNISKKGSKKNSTLKRQAG